MDNLVSSPVLEATFGYAFNDFAGSVVVHGVGGQLALGAVLSGARRQIWR